MAGTTVKVNAETYAKLKETAMQTGRSMVEVLTSAVEVYRRRVFIEGLNSDFDALRQNRRAWADEQSERDAWDVTLTDDLQGD
ncbi:MAG: toxin-antitoxin system protein [Pirellulaceae bacterium]|nr:toxin-antitoxin system protein [Pirellulaceae bacterium]